MAEVTFVEGWGVYAETPDTPVADLPDDVRAVGWLTSVGAHSSDTVAISRDPQEAVLTAAVVGRNRGSALARQVAAPANGVLAFGFSVIFTDTTDVFREVAYLLEKQSNFRQGEDAADFDQRYYVGVDVNPKTAEVKLRSSASEEVVAVSFDPQAAAWVEVIWDTTNGNAELWVNNEMATSMAVSTAFTSVDSRFAVALGSVTSQQGYVGETHYGAVYVAGQRLGRCQVFTRRPSTDSAVEFNRLQGDSNASQVADPLGMDGDATYVRSVELDVKDLYASDDVLPITNERVFAVSVTAYGRKEDVPPLKLKPVISHNGNESVGLLAAPLAIRSYTAVKEAFSEIPGTGAPWTKTAAENHTFGMTVVG